MRDYLANLPQLKYPKRPSFRCTELVRVHIKLNKDANLHKAFYEWQIKTGCYDEMGYGISAPNAIVGFFTPERAEMVRKWLKDCLIREYK